MGTKGRSRSGRALVLATLLCSAAVPGTPARAAAPQPAPTASPGMSVLHQASEDGVHDHTPRHDGVVGMAGARHVEAVLLPGGVLHVHLTDLQRSPLPLTGVSGTVTIVRGDMRSRLDLVVHDDALEARIGPLPGPSVDVRIELTLPDEPLLIDFTLPASAQPAS